MVVVEPGSRALPAPLDARWAIWARTAWVGWRPGLDGWAAARGRQVGARSGVGSGNQDLEGRGSHPACFAGSIGVSVDVAGRILDELGRPDRVVRGVGDDGDERRTGSATEFGPDSDVGNAFQTGAVGDSEPGDDCGCNAAGHVSVSLDGTLQGRFS